MIKIYFINFLNIISLVRYKKAFLLLIIVALMGAGFLNISVASKAKHRFRVNSSFLDAVKKMHIGEGVVLGGMLSAYFEAEQPIELVYPRDHDDFHSQDSPFRHIGFLLKLAPFFYPGNIKQEKYTNYRLQERQAEALLKKPHISENGKEYIFKLIRSKTALNDNRFYMYAYKNLIFISPEKI
jgi:hypothetical protein